MQQQQQSMHAGGQNAGPGQNGSMTGHLSQGVGDPSSMQQSNGPIQNGPDLRPLTALTGLSDPKQINEVLQYALLSAADLHRRGVPNHIIQLVENNRAFLVRQLQLQRDFHGGVAKNVPPGISGPALSRMMPNSASSFINGQPQLNTGAMNSLADGGRPQQPSQVPLGQGAMGTHQATLPNANGDIQNPQMHGQMRSTAQPQFRRPTPAELQRGAEFANKIKLEYIGRKSLCFPSD